MLLRTQCAIVVFPQAYRYNVLRPTRHQARVKEANGFQCLQAPFALKRDKA